MNTDKLLNKIWNKVKELDDVKSGIAVIKDENKLIKNEISLMKSDIAVIKDENKQMKNEFSLIKNDIAVIKDENRQMKDCLGRIEDVLNSDLRQIQRDIGKITRDMSAVYKMVARNMDEIENLKERDVG